MNSLIDLARFRASKQDAIEYLAKMRRDNEQYASRKDANQKAVEIRQEILEALFNYFTVAEEAINSMENELATEYQRGFRSGLDRGRKEADPAPHRSFDKEAYRAYHELRVKTRNPNLF